METPLDLFKKAIEKEELTEFFRGESGYSKCPGSNEYEEPTCFSYILEHGIYEYYMQKNDDSIISKIEDALVSLQYDTLGIYCIVSFLDAYLEDAYKCRAPFRLSINNLAGVLRETLTKKRDELIEEKRWSGSQWNSEKGELEPIALGIWKTILSYGRHFHDKYNVNILPDSSWDEINSNPDDFIFYC